MSDTTTKKTETLTTETLAIHAQTALLRGKAEAAWQAMPISLVDRPWVSWVVLPAAILVGVSSATALALA
jgi:hypothetical protein